jgi:hypothetical protein
MVYQRRSGALTGDIVACHGQDLLHYCRLMASLKVDTEELLNVPNRGFQGLDGRRCCCLGVNMSSSRTVLWRKAPWCPRSVPVEPLRVLV